MKATHRAMSSGGSAPPWNIVPFCSLALARAGQMKTGTCALALLLCEARLRALARA